MSRNLLRGILNAAATQLIIAWLIAQFFTDRAGWLLVVAMGLLLTTGYMSFCDRCFRSPVDEAYEDAREVLG